MKHIAVFLLLLLPVSAVCETGRQQKEMTLSASGIDRLEVICGAGSLSIQGMDDGNTIHVTADIQVEDIQADALQRFIKENVRLSLKKSLKKAVLMSDVAPSAPKALNPRIGLSVVVPETVNVKITDGSGSIRVRGLDGNLEINDDTGRIEIETISGDVTVNDGSGSIAMEDIEGRVRIRDGSGFIDIYHVEGNVVIIDGSGEITAQRIDGNITLADDSGDITIRGVSGNVFISETGSGELDIDLVRGKVTIREQNL